MLTLLIAVNDTQDIIAKRQAGVVQYPFLTYGMARFQPILRQSTVMAFRLA